MIVAIATAHLFRPLNTELLTLLRGLTAEQWEAPTIAGKWQVRDVVAHLLDGDLRRLSFHRDKHPVPLRSSSVDNYESLVRFINELNQTWVEVARRISPQLLIDLLEVTGRQTADFFEKLDPMAPAFFGVAWAGERESLNWLDTGREYTERWHHQQQIRVAVGAPELLEPKWFKPVIELSVLAIPRAFRHVNAPVGTCVCFVVLGESGGRWHVRRSADGWRLERPNGTAHCTVTCDERIAWRLLYNALPTEQTELVRIDGAWDLAAPLFRARSVMV